MIKFIDRIIFMYKMCIKYKFVPWAKMCEIPPQAKEEIFSKISE